MQDLVEILAEVSKRLEALSIPYMLTGGLAQHYYAIERTTADVDLVMELEIKDVPRFVAEFDRDFYVPKELAISAVRKRSEFNIIHLQSVIKVDCIVKKNSEYAETAFQRRQPAEVAGAKTFVASKEDLILSKLEWAKKSESDRQMHDLRNLLSTGYDETYVKSWAERLGVTGLLARCLGE